VFAAGMFRDSSGQWAFSETELIAKQFVPIYPPALRRAGQDYPPARDVVSGCQHVVVLAETDDGATTVFTRGCAEQGQLGRVSKNKSERGAMFRTISDAELPEEFVEELECRRTTPSCLQNLLAFCPVTVDRKKKVAKVFAGGYSTVAVTDDGATYGWGLNNYGQVSGRWVEWVRVGWAGVAILWPLVLGRGCVAAAVCACVQSISCSPDFVIAAHIIHSLPSQHRAHPRIQKIVSQPSTFPNVQNC
jgi:hypothetical protein